MNEKEKSSIKIRRALFWRSVSGNCKRSIQSSELSRGLYCVSRLKRSGGDGTLCVLLDDGGSFLTERIINRDFSKALDKLCDEIKSFASSMGSKRLILASAHSLQVSYLLLASRAVVISDILRESGIITEGYYISNGTDFENLLPISDSEETV